MIFETFSLSPHLKQVATLPCNLSLIVCFLTLMFHKVVWQHTQGLVGFLVTVYYKITRESASERILNFS